MFVHLQVSALLRLSYILCLPLYRCRMGAFNISVHLCHLLQNIQDTSLLLRHVSGVWSFPFFYIKHQTLNKAALSQGNLAMPRAIYPTRIPPGISE